MTPSELRTLIASIRQDLSYLDREYDALYDRAYGLSRAGGGGGGKRHGGHADPTLAAFEDPRREELRSRLTVAVELARAAHKAVIEAVGKVNTASARDRRNEKAR